MTGDACRRARGEILQLTQTRRDALLVRNVLPRVKTKPRLRRTMTTLAADPIFGFSSCDESRREKSLRRRMADRASRGRCGIGDLQLLRDLCGTGAAEEGVRRRVFIQLFEDYTGIFADAAAVTTR